METAAIPTSFGERFKRFVPDRSGMATNQATAGRDEAKRFLVTCDDCAYERPAAGRAEATRLGDDHRRETGHELVALEVPASSVGS